MIREFLAALPWWWWALAALLAYGAVMDGLAT